MANTIKLRRSNVAGNAPTTAQLDFGEVAINTADGLMYIKRDDGTGEEIISVNGATSGSGISGTIFKFAGTGNAGNGEIRFNNSNYANVTSVSISNEDEEGQDLTNLLQNFFGEGDLLYVQQQYKANKAVIFNVTGAPNTSNSQRTVFPVTFRESTGSNIQNGKEAYVAFIKDTSAVTSVNGQQGDVLLGVGDLTDTDLTTTAPVLDDILVYDGSNWVPEAKPTGGGGSSVSISETPPTGGTDGDLWYDSSTDAGKLYVQYGGQFVATAATGANGADGTNGTDGLGFTGGSYDAGTGIVTFTSDDGLGFSTTDLRGADGSDGNDGADGLGVPAGGTAGQVLAKIDGTDNNTEWVDQGGSVTPMYISIRGPGGTQTLQTIAETINVDGFTNALSDSSHFLVSNGSDSDGSIRVVNAGTYQISYNVFAVQTGGNRVGVTAMLYRNGAIVSGTKQYSYSRNTTQDAAGCSSTVILDCSANDIIQVRADKDSSVAIAAELASCSLTLLRIV